MPSPIYIRRRDKGKFDPSLVHGEGVILLRFTGKRETARSKGVPIYTFRGRLIKPRKRK